MLVSLFCKEKFFRRGWDFLFCWKKSLFIQFNFGFLKQLNEVF
jgi:hypothetical protein